jgi:hypothetical protein
MTRDTKAFYIEYRREDWIQQVYDQCVDKDHLAMYKAGKDQVVALSGSDLVDNFLAENGFTERRENDYYVYTISDKLFLGADTLFSHLPKRV